MSDIDPKHLRMLEAILFASASPLSERALAGRMPEDADVKALLTELQAQYADRGVNLAQAGGSWVFRTAPDVAVILTEERTVARKLSRAAIETMAIIAFHQPVTRAEIEEIRGVGLSKGTLDVLFEEGWIRPKGRRRTPGRPMTWGTTDDFLDHFGLASLKDLPGMDELKAAGLLDKRAAIEVYRVTGGLDAAAENDDGDGDEDLFTAEPLDDSDDRDGPLDPGAEPPAP